MVDYIGIEDIRRLAQALGTGEFIARLAREIEDDYRRWDEFEKCAPLANHSAVGVRADADTGVVRGRTLGQDRVRARLRATG